MEITELPSYKGEWAAYKAAKAAAGEDELALAQAELAWARKTGELQMQAVRLDAEQRRLQDAQQQVSRDYPGVPEALLAGIDDPERLVATAKAFAEAVKGAAPATQQTGNTPSTQSWGRPPSAVPGTHAENQRVIDKRLQELAPSVLTGRNALGANREFRDLTFQRALNAVVGRTQGNQR